MKDEYIFKRNEVPSKIADILEYRCFPNGCLGDG